MRHFSIGLLFLAALADAGVAQQNEQPPLNGVIYGVVIGHDGEPAKGLALAARPLGVGGTGGLLRTRTNDAGEYRFKKLPRWGKYIIYAEDEKAGYSRISTGPIGDIHPSEIEITPESTDAPGKEAARKSRV